MFDSNLVHLSAYEKQVRRSDKTFRFRQKADHVQRWIRSCAVCSSSLPPIDLVCDGCWNKLAQIRNRGAELLQNGYPFPVYALFTWTEENESLIKPFIYGFKNGFAVSAANDLAIEFLTERNECAHSRGETLARNRVLIQPPSDGFDHGELWTKALSERALSPVWPVLAQGSNVESGRQKRLDRVRRAERRFEIREQIAGSWPLGTESGSLIFCDDVVTTGSTAMAAFMALGDPEAFEVWTLVARPRIARN